MADPSQPRESFSDESIQRLAKSIQEQGQLSPIRVRWSEEHRKWMIVAGERRWRASLRAGLPTIECYFHEVELAPSEILEQQLIENCLREDLRPTEEAKAFQRLMNLNGWNQKKLATALRVSETRVTRVLSLLKLPQEIRDDLDSGKLKHQGGLRNLQIAESKRPAKVGSSGNEWHLDVRPDDQGCANPAGKGLPQAFRYTSFIPDGGRVEDRRLRQA